MTIQPGSGETPPSDNPPPRPPQPPAEPPARPKRDLGGIASLLNAGIGIVVLVLGFFGGAGVQASAGGPFPQSTTTVTVTPTGPPATTPPATTPSATTPPPTTTAAPSPSAASTIALSTLTPLSGAFLSANTSPSLNGQAQPQAIIQDLGCAPTGDAQYNLSRGYTRFTALVGLDDNSQDSKVAPTLTIVGDGRQLTTVFPKFGTPSKLDVDVTGVIRLEIKWSYTRPPQNPIPIQCVPNAQLVLGNGQLTPTAT